MKNKKILLIIIGFILAFSIIGGTLYLFKDEIFDYTSSVDENFENEKEEIATATPLLYEVTKEGEDTKIYLFGSIHVADDRAYPMQDKILEAYSGSEYLAVELDLISFEKDFKAQMEMLQMFLCESGKTLKDYLSEEGYEIIIQYMKDNDVYNSAYEMYRPSMLYSLISGVSTDKSGLNSDDGIDRYFLKKAKRNSKKILELESAELQYKLLASMPDELYEMMIISFIKNEEKEIASLKEMYEAWLNGNIEEFLNNSNQEDIDIEAIKEDLSLEEQQLFDQVLELMENFNKAMNDDRNDGMLGTIDTYFKEDKNVFVVVGAAHVVGEYGLVNELGRLGYKVQLIEYK